MSDELEACPYCKLNKWQHEGTEAGELWYSCQGCGADTPVSTHATGDDYTEATKLANIRPIEDALRAELAAKDAEIAAVMDIVRAALKDYPMFNSERCVSALLKIRKVVSSDGEEAPHGHR